MLFLSGHRATSFLNRNFVALIQYVLMIWRCFPPLPTDAGLDSINSNHHLTIESQIRKGKMKVLNINTANTQLLTQSCT